MNILQTIWSALTQSNEMLTNILLIPLAYVDAYVVMLFFTTLLNIQTTTKRKLLYVLIYGIIGNILTFLVPSSYKIFISILIWPILICVIFKIHIIKSLLAEIIPMIVSAVLETIFANIFLLFFNITTKMILEIPLYRISIAIIIYLVLFLLTKFIYHLKINIKIFDNMNTKSKFLLLVNAILLVVVIALQFYLITFYSNLMPLFVNIINIIGLITYFIISMYSIINISKLEITKRDLESANLTINSLTILHDNVRAFKHDFDNIVNCIGGYVITEDLEGLKTYYNQLLEECNKTNNLYALSPKVINHPSIYHILATKYYEADQKNVQINLNVFLDLNEIEKRMKIYDFTRILGILLDNAIEAAKECDKKIINVTFRKDLNRNMLAIIVQNTYTNKDVNTEEIYQKGVSSKENHSGLGLWKVRQILMRNNNLNLFTTKDAEYFTQQFEIFK